MLYGPVIFRRGLQTRCTPHRDGVLLSHVWRDGGWVAQSHPCTAVYGEAATTDRSLGWKYYKLTLNGRHARLLMPLSVNEPVFSEVITSASCTEYLKLCRSNVSIDDTGIAFHYK